MRHSILEHVNQMFLIDPSAMLTSSLLANIIPRPERPRERVSVARITEKAKKEKGVDDMSNVKIRAAKVAWEETSGKSLSRNSRGCKRSARINMDDIINSEELELRINRVAD